MSKKIEELLAVLDMTEEEQGKAIEGLLWDYSSMDTEDVNEFTGLQLSLANIAFRLRDDVNKGDDIFAFGNAVKLVFVKVHPQLKPPKTYHGKLVMWRWLAEKAQPIHFIIVALLAKTGKDGGE